MYICEFFMCDYGAFQKWIFTDNTTHIAKYVQMLKSCTYSYMFLTCYCNFDINFYAILRLDISPNFAALCFFAFWCHGLKWRYHASDIISSWWIVIVVIAVRKKVQTTWHKWMLQFWYVILQNAPITICV